MHRATPLDNVEYLFYNASDERTTNDQGSTPPWEETPVNRGYKPDAYASVSAYVVAHHAQRVIDFLRQTFDAEELRRFDKPDGSIMHAEVRIDDAIVMIADSSGDCPAFPVWLHVYVPDVDATYQRALTAGGVAVQEPTQKDDPDRRGGVRDPAGNTWWIATQSG